MTEAAAGSWEDELSGRERVRAVVETLDGPATARIEGGFELFTDDAHDRYWLNWIEPNRDLLVGWHQDETHPDLGPVHLQVNDGDEPVAHESATFVDAHRLDVSSRRLEKLPAVVQAVEWVDNRPTGLDMK